VKQNIPVKPEGTQAKGLASDAVWSPPNEAVAPDADEDDSSDDDSSDDNSPARSGSGANNSWPKLAYSIKEFCHRANIGQTKTYELIAEGKLKSRKVGRHRLILHEDALELLRSLPSQ
jgi:excisionase family DNA binding protein